MFSSAAIVAVIWSGCTTTAIAQEGAALEEVVVTARRVEENIQDTPVAVTALSGDRLQELYIKNTTDLMKLAPGLQIGGCSGSTRNCVPVVRGQGSAFATGRSSVVPYFGEVAFFQQSYFDLQNVQVVKGPQGTLFGETATGGVILYTPRKPSNDFSGYAEASLGNYKYRTFEGAVGGAIIPDKVMARAAVEYRKRDGYTEGRPSFAPGTTTNLDNLDRLQWRFSLVLKPFENVENYTIYAGSTDSQRGLSSIAKYADPRFMNPGVRNVIPANVPSLAAQWEFTTGAPPPPGKTFGQLLVEKQAQQTAAGAGVNFYNYNRARKEKFTGFINQTRWDILENLSLRNIYGLYWTKSRGPTLDTDGSDLPLTDTRAVWVPGTTSQTNGTYAWQGGKPARAWTNETQLLGSLFDKRLEWQAGYYYSRSGSRNWTGGQGVIAVFTTPQGDPAAAAFCTSVGVTSPCSQITTSKTESHAYYGQVTVGVTDALHLTGGYRRTWDYRRTDASAAATYFVNFKGFNIATAVDGRSPLPGAGTVPTIVPEAHQDTYTITGDWKISDRILVYAAHRTGYKAGGINANAVPGSAERVFGPETLKDVELGLKADWSVGDILGRTNVAAYKNWYKNIQRSQIIAGTATTYTTNLADADLQGVEIDTNVVFTEWLKLAANFSYLDAKYTRWTENLVCSAQFWRPMCVGLPGTTPMVIDHVKGTVIVNGGVTNFKPDAMQDASKYKWSLQPTVMLKPWTGEDITVGFNVYYSSSYTGNAANTSAFAGLTPLVQQSIVGELSEPFFIKARTLMDLRVDWSHVRDSKVSLSGGITNLADKTYNFGNGCGFTINGSACALIGEPRFWYAQARYEF